MPVDSLYCEKCGADIHIVPDFEPELEFSMTQTLNGIKEELTEQTKSARQPDTAGRKAREREAQERAGQGEQSGQEGTAGQEKEARKSGNAGKIRLIGLAAAGVLAILVTVEGVRVYQAHSYEYQLRMAASSAAQERYEKAIRYYSRALELDSRDLEVRFALAEAYFLKGNQVEYEYLLRGVIQDPAADEDQLDRAYKKLIAIYRDRKDYVTIHEIVKNSGSDRIRETYQVYLANVPEFSYQTGAYGEILPLKLASVTAGKIYYTLDGSEPSEESELYTAPIFLEDGDHVVKAFFVNEYGIASDCVTKAYHIETAQAVAPEINLFSGDYSVPAWIEVVNAQEGAVYYTTDGSDPNLHSTAYTGAIPMPLGKSRFKFALVGEDGSVGEITQRTFQLRLDTTFTPEIAEGLIVQHMLSVGKIADEDGAYAVPGTDGQTAAGKYGYRYQYVTNIDDADDFFVIAEIYVDETGLSAKTGSYFAVNAYSGACYKLQIGERNRYTLAELTQDPGEG
jgi:hypothetical protein